MGASKRCAELYVQSLNADDCPTRFVAVRFGNVIGSSGSVVPIFRKQIDAGGPVTVTHPDMKRYFMTIAEASQLVMQAGAIGQGGEIFILDMGEPIKILSLAKEMIRRRGLKPGKDIAIEFTGIRPGEKLYEELACENEQTRPTSHPKIRVWQLARATAQQIDQMLKNLQSVTNSPHREIVQALMRSVPEYQSTTTEIPTLKIVASAA
jgi:FlaA1/EpsC-like NDP-sugar epimerase